MRYLRTVVAAVSLLLVCGTAHAFTLHLNGGEFYGPGDKGTHPLPPNAEVRNITLTQGLSGFIPFFNNGSQAPNVIAEILQGGPLDGLTSSGVLINENIDTGLILKISDKTSGESANMMVVAVASEKMVPDEKGNFTFNPSVIADPGISGLTVPFSVLFTTGAAEIPLSLKTQQGLSGGHDQAGPFASGHVLIGRIGDFDQDGYLDGTLVLASNSPLALIVARGDPIAQNRPWTSDIPIAPLDAGILTLNGILQNFPDAIHKTVQSGLGPVTINYLTDINHRIEVVMGNLRRAMRKSDMMIASGARNSIHKARRILRDAHETVEDGIESFEDNNVGDAVTKIDHAFGQMVIAIQLLATLGSIH